MNRKRGNFIKLFFVSFFLIFFLNEISALGIGPAKIEFNFQPGLEQQISYTVFGSSVKELELYTRGDLSQYITFDKPSIKPGESFTATIKLPDKTERPGQQLTYIGVREKVDPEVVHGNIGTAVGIEVLIVVFVPYPGRYLEAHLTSHDVNVGEPVGFQLDLTSKGTEEVTIVPKIEIFSSKGDKKEELTFKERTIKSQESISLTKTLNTLGYNPGTYKAVATVNYGNIATTETPFRIGNLNIGIMGYTNKLVIGKLQKFEVAIQSGWNNAIDGVYGEVVILNGTKELDRFKTTTTGLTPWENKTIEGYLDTTNYSIGFYDANITLFYFGGEKGSTTSKLVKIEFIKTRSLLIWYIIGGVGLLTIVILLSIKYFRRSTKKRGK